MFHLKRHEISFCSLIVSGIRRAGNDTYMPFKSQITANFAVSSTGIYSENYNQVPSRCVWGLFKFHITREVFWNHLSRPRSMGCCTEAGRGLNWLVHSRAYGHGHSCENTCSTCSISQFHCLANVFDSYLSPFQCCVHINRSVKWTLR